MKKMLARKLGSTLLIISMCIFVAGCGIKAENDVNEAPLDNVPAVEAVQDPDISSVEVVEAEPTDEELLIEAKNFLFPADAKRDIDSAKAIIEPLANAGNAEACYLMGWILEYEPDYLDVNGMKAAEYYKKAVEQNFTKAILALGLNISVGTPDEVKEYTKKAIESGIENLSDEELGCDGMYLLGIMYSDSYLYDNADNDKSLEWYQKAADAGLPVAMICVANHEEDPEVKLQMLQKIADMGDYHAINNIGYMYCYGDGVEKDPEKAIELFEKAADMGFTPSMRNLAGMYENGNGVEQDYEKAVEWYRKAADLGNSSAMNDMSYMYREGLGVEKDDEESFKWALKGAELNHPYAMGQAGYCYLYGVGTEQNTEKGIELCEKAGAWGHSNSYVNLGALYADGEYVEQDLDKASEYFFKAAELGNEKGKEALNKIGYSYDKMKNSNNQNNNVE